MPPLPPHLRTTPPLRRALAAFFAVAVAAGTVIFPQPGAALVFNPHRLFTDAELADSGSLSTAAIQKFLEQRGSVLATFRENVGGTSLTAAQIFARVAQENRVSPKFLLAVVEREKSLLHKGPNDAKASDLDWAAGYSCFSSRCNDKYKGFFNQVESAAITQNIYAARPDTFPYQVGKPAKTRDGFVVTPENQATANLYTYTPFVGHSPELGIVNGIGGNRLFHTIWQRYFTEAKYPDGLMLSNGVNFWKIEGGKKRKFQTAELYLADYRTEDAVIASGKVLNAYADGPEIVFANRTIVRAAASGQALLLLDGFQRPIVEEAALARLSDFRLAITTFAEIPRFVPSELLDPYPLGTPITEALPYPLGELFAQEGTTTQWWVQDGVRHPVHPVVAQANWPNRAAREISPAMLAAFPVGREMTLRAGTLVRTEAGSYYAISTAERRKIASAELFDRLFGSERRARAVTIPDAVLDLHAPGLIIDYINDSIQDPPPPPAPPAAPPFQAGAVTLQPEAITGTSNQEIAITVATVNTGNAAWQPGTVTLRINRGAPIPFREGIVPPGGTATFAVALTLPVETGLQPQTFALLGPDGAVLEQFAKFAIVKPAIAAEIISHTLPIAVKNSWRPVPIKVILKNVSADLAWTSAKTALRIITPDGKTSPFYDVNDWVKTDVPAVPVNRKTIKPGETGEFNFTLKSKGVKPGTYELQFVLELRDAGKTALIASQDSWTRSLRVDR